MVVCQWFIRFDTAPAAGPLSRGLQTGHLVGIGAGQFGWPGVSVLVDSIGRTVPPSEPRRLLVVFGRPLGSLFAIWFLLFVFYISSITLRDLADFMGINYTETPIELLTILFMVVCVYALLGGLVVIARLNDFLFPVVIIGTIFITLFSLPEWSLDNFLPFLKNGLQPVMKGLWFHTVLPYGGAVAFLMIFPYARRPADNRRAAWWGTLLVLVILFIWTVGTINVLGAEGTARAVYPSHRAARLVSIGGFLRRTDGFVDIVWLASYVTRFLVLLYAMTLGTAQLVGVRDYRYLAIPVAALVVVGSFMSYDNIIEHLVSAQFYPWLGLPVFLVIPFLCLLVAHIRGLKGVRPK